MLLLSFYYYLFDMIDHGILCKKVEFYGIRQQPLKWFKLYLYNRKEYSRENGIDTSVMEKMLVYPKAHVLDPPIPYSYKEPLTSCLKRKCVDECISLFPSIA